MFWASERASGLRAAVLRRHMPNSRRCNWQGSIRIFRQAVLRWPRRFACVVRRFEPNALTCIAVADVFFLREYFFLIPKPNSRLHPPPCRCLRNDLDPGGSSGHLGEDFRLPATGRTCTPSSSTNSRAVFMGQGEMFAQAVKHSRGHKHSIEPNFLKNVNSVGVFL